MTPRHNSRVLGAWEMPLAVLLRSPGRIALCRLKHQTASRMDLSRQVSVPIVVAISGLQDLDNVRWRNSGTVVNVTTDIVEAQNLADKMPA